MLRTLAIVWVMASHLLAAAAGGPLPTFPVVAADGTRTTSASMAREGKWILIYVPAQCGGCGSLLGQVAKAERSFVAPHVTIVVGGASAEAVREEVAGFPELAEARWYADPESVSSSALQLGAMPAVIGLDGASIEWSLSGVLGASSDVLSAIVSWLQRT